MRWLLNEKDLCKESETRGKVKSFPKDGLVYGTSIPADSYCNVNKSLRNFPSPHKRNVGKTSLFAGARANQVGKNQVLWFVSVPGQSGAIRVDGLVLWSKSLVLAVMRSCRSRNRIEWLQTVRFHVSVKSYERERASEGLL